MIHSINIFYRQKSKKKLLNAIVSDLCIQYLVESSSATVAAKLLLFYVFTSILHEGAIIFCICKIFEQTDWNVF